jgi:hypothetical protein
MKKTKSTFECKECGAKAEDILFPYANGWKYLYILSWKDEPDTSKTIRDFKFCSPKCIASYIKKAIK